jgi:predicted RNA-binding Zn-ribbon protein involved in translation (DUF1610 family)
MPIRPEPRTYYCPKCGWQKTTAPRSDALMPGDFYAECPKCGNPDIKIREAGFLTKLVSAINRI